MLNIGKLNLYDTDAAKAFIYDILTENRQLRSAADAADSLAAERDAALVAAQEGDR